MIDAWATREEVVVGGVGTWSSVDGRAALVAEVGTGVAVALVGEAVDEADGDEVYGCLLAVVKEVKLAWSLSLGSC